MQEKEFELLKDFAEFLIRDYEIVCEGDNLLWELAGTKQRYTSAELCKIWLTKYKK